MNRRQFLSKLLAVPIVAAPALELGRKIFLPPLGGWFSNRVLNENSLEDILIDIKNAVDNDGKRIVLQPLYMLVPADFRKVVEPILRETFDRVYSEHEDEWAAIYNGSLV